MLEIFSKLHGTTTDKFSIGQKNLRITLTGLSSTAESVELLDRDSGSYQTDNSVFFTAYVIAQGTNTAAFEIKGCYVSGTTGTTGYVVNTYVDTGGFTDPIVTFSSSGQMSVTCTGLAADNIRWTAVVDLVLV
jgi:hypothetical protein